MARNKKKLILMAVPLVAYAGGDMPPDTAPSAVNLKPGLS
jgi:hypothetical protein